jgi:hypothetical protein
MANRKHSAQRLKKRRTYNVREAAKEIGATPGTIRRWREAGLKPVEGSYPPFFRGAVLIDFLKKRSAERKQPCGPGRMFCFKCKEPKRPAFDEIEYRPTTAKSGRLTGLCPDCATVMNRRVSLAKLCAAAGDLSVSMQCDDSRLSETSPPHCNDDSEGA